VKRLPAILTLALLMSLFSWLFLRRATKRRTVIAADGRTFELISPGAADGNGAAAIWRPVPADGNDYTPNLGWALDESSGAPMMRRFV
jgi:hypothetical protein